MDGSAVRTNRPYIEFDRETKRFNGDGGCNRISGGFEVDGAALRFSRVITGGHPDTADVIVRPVRR